MLTEPTAADTNPADLRVLIADDEEAPRAQLEAALRQVAPQAQLVACCAHGVDAWDAWLAHEPDLCLLDIRMPGMSGLEVAERIAGRTPVVFVTAHGDHALQAFEAGAVDYVLKPVEPDRLHRALQRALQRTRPEPTSADAAQLQQLLQQLLAERRRPAIDTLQAGLGKEVRLIRVADVVYFEADARYTRVVYVSEGVPGEALIRTPLKELLAQLDGRAFWQVHRSVVVAQRHIAAAVRLDEGRMHLTLRGRPETLPVSRHFQGLFKGQ